MGASPLTEPAGVTPPAVGTPAYLQQAYDLTSLSAIAGSGKTLGIVDAYGYPTAASDLAAFRSHFGLPACTTASGCLSIANQTGGTSYPQGNAQWDQEQALDMDVVSSICPNCHILLVQATDNAESNLEAAESEAAALGATSISNSWEYTGPASTAPQSSAFTFPGVAVVAAAGDSGYDGGTSNTIWPAALPTVTAVGGTSLPLSTSPGGRGVTESAWSGDGSGCASETKPSWQADSGCSGRAYADISAVGDPATGLDVYNSQSGGFVVVGGTSLSDQVVSAYYALIDGSAGVGNASWDYGNSSLLNDITSGSDGDCSAYPGASTSAMREQGTTDPRATAASPVPPSLVPQASPGQAHPPWAT